MQEQAGHVRQQSVQELLHKVTKVTLLTAMLRLTLDLVAASKQRTFAFFVHTQQFLRLVSV